MTQRRPELEWRTSCLLLTGRRDGAAQGVRAEPVRPSGGSAYSPEVAACPLQSCGPLGPALPRRWAGRCQMQGGGADGGRRKVGKEGSALERDQPRDLGQR